MAAASVAVAGAPLISVFPPLDATFIRRSTGSYWYTAVSHDAVLAVIGEKQAEFATGC